MTLVGRRTEHNLLTRFCYMGIVSSPLWPLMSLPPLGEEAVCSLGLQWEPAQSLGRPGGVKSTDVVPSLGMKFSCY